MSELKAIDDLYERRIRNGSDPYKIKLVDVRHPPVYLKSEADKVIAELKEERDWLAKDRAQAYDDLEKRAQLNIKQEESIRHQKYKRCLKMAELCRAKRDEIIALTPTLILNHPTEYLTRWENRWLELAEKFKPNT